MLSNSRFTHAAVHFFALGFIGFGSIWFFDIPKALSFFELPAPEVPISETLQIIAIVYGIRDVFMGVAMSMSALFGTTKATGLITIAAGLVAAVDGFACRYVLGKGEWGHWQYAPVVVATGLVSLGLFD